jgi:hypothetical protein
MYETESDDGAVKINGTPTGGRLTVFEHGSGSLTITLGSWCTHFHAYFFSIFLMKDRRFNGMAQTKYLILG